MCHNAAPRSVAKTQACAARCSSCYRPAPYHRKHCALAAATIKSAENAENDALPSYDHATSSTPLVVYESRYRPHGPIGFAVRWGVEKVQEKRDEKKFMEEFEEQRRMQRRMQRESSSSLASSGDEAETIKHSWEGDNKWVERKQMDRL